MDTRIELNHTHSNGEGGWKNELINIGDFYLDRREMTIILTCSSNNHARLGNACHDCSYAWAGEFDEWLEKHTETATKMVEIEF